MNNMDFSFTLFLLVLAFSFQSSSSFLSSLTKGSSISVENPEDKIISQNGMFSAGFTSIGENSYSFAIWFTEPTSLDLNKTIIWMANRDQPVNGKRTKLSLLNTGNIALLDVSLNNVWSSNTASLKPLELHLKNDGNLVLRELQGINILWQSFDSPTDTLLPGQPLTRYTKLVSSISESNHSSGFYMFFFDDENILGLHYDGRDVSSSYWPSPWLLSWDVGRSNFNSSRNAVLDSFGSFHSSDNFTFSTSDYGTVMQRMMKLDSDGVVRVYSRTNVSQNWYVSWQAFTGTCLVHGICGANSTCSYSPKIGRKCSCIPGYRMKNPNDWSYGCEPMFDFTCNKSKSTFLEIKNVEFYGYDFHYIENVFVKPTDGVMAKLARVEPYVTYGYANLKTIKELIYKKGHAKIDKRKVPLTDNNLIEQELGKFGIVCIEDIVHQIDNVGPHFKEVVRFMWPFELNKPADGLKGLKNRYKDGGDSGDREDLINELVNKMN